MSTRSTILLIVLGAGFVGLFVTVRSESYAWSTSDAWSMAVAGLLYVAVAALAVRAWNKRPAEGFFGLRRSVWVVMASSAAGLAAFMLLSILAMPWVGLKGFEILSGNFLLVVGGTVLFYPLIAKYLK